jgi:hypothetical protein
MKLLGGLLLSINPGIAFNSIMHEKEALADAISTRAIFACCEVRVASCGVYRGNRPRTAELVPRISCNYTVVTRLRSP